MLRSLRAIFIIFVLVFTAGCQAGRTYRMDLAYLPVQLPELSKNLSQVPRLAVVLFQDVRVPPADVGYRIHLGGGTDLFKTDRAPIPQEVTEVVAEYLRLRGFDVKVFTGDEKPSRDANSPFNDIVEGTIEGLRVEARSNVGYTQVNSRVKLSSRIYNPKKRATQTVSAETQDESKIVLFNVDSVSRSLNQVLAQAIEQMYKDAPF